MARAVLIGALGTGSLLSGLAFDSPALTVTGIALALLAGGCAIWISTAAQGAAIERARLPHRIEAGKPMRSRIVLRRGPLPAPVTILPTPGEALLSVRPGPQRSSLSYESELILTGRGRRTIPAPAATAADPLGICGVSLDTGPSSEVLVLPAVERLAGDVLGGRGFGSIAGVGSGDEDDGTGASAGGLDVDGTRPFRPGMPASRIHWPSVARSGELIERRLIAGSARRPLIVLDSSSPADEAALDRAISAAASVAHHLSSRGGCTLLMASSRPLAVGPSSWRDVHVRLALLDAGGRVPSIPAGLRAGSLIWVSASAERPVPRIVRGTGVRSFVLIRAVGETAGGPALCGCTVEDLTAAALARQAA
jgi:uncharacterized protein (DUF58 family)